MENFMTTTYTKCPETIHTSLLKWRGKNSHGKQKILNFLYRKSSFFNDIWYYLSHIYEHCRYRHYGSNILDIATKNSSLVFILMSVINIDNTVPLNECYVIFLLFSFRRARSFSYCSYESIQLIINFTANKL